MKLLLLACIMAVAGPVFADARPQRSAAQVRAFKKLSTCPAGVYLARRCPGYVVDHVVPLCAGGADHPSNMQWQTVAQAKLKDVTERAQCRELRRDRSRR